MGPGACSHIRVSFVTCTLGMLASRNKCQGTNLTHPCPVPWHWHCHHSTAREGLPMPPVMAQQVRVPREEVLGASVLSTPEGISGQP